MQPNMVYIEAEEYRNLVAENATLNERMGRLYSYMERQEVQSAKWAHDDGKEYYPTVNFDMVEKITNYKRSLAVDKEIKKIMSAPEAE